MDVFLRFFVLKRSMLTGRKVSCSLLSFHLGPNIMLQMSRSYIGDVVLERLDIYQLLGLLGQNTKRQQINDSQTFL